jgi:hypothetical protein
MGNTWIGRTAAIVLSGLVVAGCAYDGETTTPIGRNLSWFSYLNGDDIGYGCGKDGIDRYRMVYNAVYVEQVRAYDLTVSNDGQSNLRTRITGRADLSKITLEKPLDILSPWREKSFERQLTDAEAMKIRQSLTESDLEAPLTERIQLHSDNFYWVVSACENGRFRFNAFAYPSERFAKLTFPEVLFALDTSGIAVNQPRKTDPRKIHDASDGEELRSAKRFNLAAESGGLIGIGRPF